MIFIAKQPLNWHYLFNLKFLSFFVRIFYYLFFVADTVLDLGFKSYMVVALGFKHKTELDRIEAN